MYALWDFHNTGEGAFLLKQGHLLQRLQRLALITAYQLNHHRESMKEGRGVTIGQLNMSSHGSGH